MEAHSKFNLVELQGSHQEILNHANMEISTNAAGALIETKMIIILNLYIIHVLFERLIFNEIYEFIILKL